MVRPVGCETAFIADSGTYALVMHHLFQRMKDFSDVTDRLAEVWLPTGTTMNS